MSRIHAALLGGAMGLTSMSCVNRESPPLDHEGTVASHEEPLSGQGMEALIPLRLVNVLPCAPGPSCPDNADYHSVLRSVDAANEVFKAVGVQFWAKSVERYHMPSFADLRYQSCGGTGDVRVPWSQVRAQLKQVLPSMSDAAWPEGEMKTPAWWLRAVNTAEAAASNPEEFVIWILQWVNCNGASTAPPPDEGRDVKMSGSGMNSSPYQLAHELGHNFGLYHTWNVDDRPDPQTLVAGRQYDQWDLVYKPGSLFVPPYEHVFFNSRAEATVYPENELALIDTGSNCSADLFGVLTCTVRACPQSWCVEETHSTGSPALKGLAFSYSYGLSGTNIMSYAGAPRQSMSDSQVQRIRKYLRWSVQVKPETTDLIRPNAVLSARLPLLGSWNVRQVAEKMDFDCDGKRDIGIWEPPTTVGNNGTFTILLSSKGFSTSSGQYMSVQLGQLGDVPVVAELSGDCRTDLAVYQPGGGLYRDDPASVQGYWRWCPTATNAESTTCSMAVVTAFGVRESVPLPGLNFAGETTRVLATFRPSLGSWSWRAVGGGTTTTKTLGGPGAVPLPGDYDGDFLTDIAVYEPGSATFKLLRSELGWASPITRPFGNPPPGEYSKFIPLNSGTSQARSGAIPLSGMNRPRTICNPWYVTYPRRVFSLWFPHDGTWTTMWDPINSTTTDTCAWGLGGVDAPVPGIDRNNDVYSDMVTYRGQTWSGPGWFYFKNATPSSPNGCTGSTSSVSYQYGNRARQRVFAVADMTGDGKPEIMLVHPDTMTIQWMTSESGYTTVYSRTIGSRRSIVL